MSADERAEAMSPDELIAIIKRGLDEDERIAEAAAGRGGPHWPNSDSEPRSPQLEHARRHDPARILAEVQSKRELLALHPHTTQRKSVGEGRLRHMYGRHWEKRLKNLDTPFCLNCHVEDGLIEGSGLCRTLIGLARPYLGSGEGRTT